MKSINLLRAETATPEPPLFEARELAWVGLAWLATMAALAGALMTGS